MCAPRPISASRNPASATPSSGSRIRSARCSFFRTTRRVSLTEDGAAFFERCRQALAAIDEAELVLKRAQIKPSGTLRIDVPVAFGRIKLVPLLRAFQDDYPDVRLRITFTDRYIDLIEEGVDICIRFGALQDSSLIARRLTTTQFNVARPRRPISTNTAGRKRRRSWRAQLPRLRLARHAADQGLALHGRRQEVTIDAARI